MTVSVWGRVSVFPRDGAYQLYAGFMSPIGIGDKHAAFEMLKAKLLEEGLFDATKKKPIPSFPRRIGIVTSPTGAAIRDMVNILGRRWPIAELELYPALVQGASAPMSLCDGIEYFNQKNNVDVIIIGRGGGSGEDLDAFNSEMLARTIFDSEIPVVSAVGHETDTSISDDVADLRAPTPSAAAELVVPNMSDYALKLTSLLGTVRGIVAKDLENKEKLLGSLARSRVLTNPLSHVEIREDELAFLGQKLDTLYRGVVSDKESEFGKNLAKINALNPLAVLSRGYSIVQKNSAVASTVDALNVGDTISVRLADGEIDATVTATNKFSENRTNE
jgi:exodeoxyribonuclease VII large subunit